MGIDNTRIRIGHRHQRIAVSKETDPFPILLKESIRCLSPTYIYEKVIPFLE